MTKICTFLLVAFIGVTAFDAPAYAYLDPGTGSMVLQLLLGGVAGAMVIVKLYWLRLKSFFSPKSKSTDSDEERGES